MLADKDKIYFFCFKQKTAYEMLRSLVGSEMCIRDRCRDPPKQVIGGHDQPRRTESALDRSGRDVRLLHRMQGVAVGESLHCLDASALGLAGRDQAGADQRAVQVDRAGATLALFAGVLRAGEPEPLAQHIEQALALPDPVGLPGLAVHRAVQLHVSSSDSPPRPNPARGRPTRTGHASGTCLLYTSDAADEE